METVELKDGWLTSQMEKVRQEVRDWPAEVKMLRNINATLVLDAGKAISDESARIDRPANSAPEAD